MSDGHRRRSPWAIAFDDNGDLLCSVEPDLDPALKARFMAAAPILMDAIDRLPIDVPGITIEEAADVVEAAAKMLRRCEGWPERLTMPAGARPA